MRLVPVACLFFALLIAPVTPVAAEEGSTYVGSGELNGPTQSKAWFHDGFWWSVLLDGADHYIHRLEGNTFITKYDQFVHEKNSARADVLSDGDDLYVLMIHNPESRFLKFLYDPVTQGYDLMPGFPIDMNQGDSSGAAMAIDGTGKLWITYRTLGRIDVMWSTSADHLNWDFTGFTLDPAVRDHDLSTIVAFGNKIGVVWSHQTLDPVKEFRFRYHVDGDPEDSGSPNEVLIQGYYNVDQYINLAATPSGEVLFVGQVSGHRNDAIDFYVRRTSGVWEGNFELTQEASRPRVIYDAENNEAYAIYEDRSSSPYVIKYKKVSLDNPEEIGAAPAIPLIVGSGSDVGDVTSTSQWVDADSGLLVLAKSGSYALHNIIEISSANTPTAVASADPTGGFAPLTVQFTGDGTDPNGFIESYEWDFGDGFGSTEQNPEHTYFDPGTYSATLTVTDDEGLTDSATVEITAVFDPALDLEAPYTFGHDPAPGAVDVAVSSKIRVHIADDGTGVDLASIVMRVDGIVVTPVITGSSPDYLVEYTPPAPFDYLDQVFVDLDAQDFAAPPRLLSESYSFTTREAPVEPEILARINFQPDESIPPAGYLVDGGNPYDAGLGYGWSHSIKEYERNSNPDQRLDTYVRVWNDEPAEWNYDLPDGEYLITVVAGSPQYTGRHTVALEGLVVIDDVPTDGGEFVEVLEYPVNVADGQLTVEIGNPAAGKKTKLCYLHISVPGVTGSPTASASAAPLGGLAPLTVQFTGDGSDPNGFIESYEWDFGDGFGSTEQSPEHTYAEPGIYSAVLTVTDNDGLTDDDTVVITVSFDPALDVTPPYTYGHDPAPGAVDVSVTSPIRVHIADDETGVDPASIVMIVNGIVVTPAISGSPSDYLLEYTPAVPFDYLQAVIVEVSAQDLAAPPNALNEGWGFVTRDVPSEPLPVAQINFQPDESIPPAGYLVDGGNPYDAGLGYGWSRNLKENERNYNPDQRLDTYVRVSNGSPAEWSYDLPPGDYQVTLVVGSPQYTGIHTVAVEGAVVIDSVSTSRGEFVELLDYPVTVTDGQLTVRIGGTASGKKTKICYLHIESLN